MSLESARARMRSEGGNIQGRADKSTKKTIAKMINDSPSRSTVGLHSENNIQYSIVSDIDNYERRSFLFHPDIKTYKGDYIYHDDFTYLVIEHDTDDKFPQSIAMVCNYDFPVRVEELETNEIVGRRPNGSPIYKTIPFTHTIPCAITAKIYSQVDNQIFSSPDGAIIGYIPYKPNEPMPELDQEVVIYDAQYYVADIIKTNIIKFNGIEKGYLELRLQRMQKNVESQS